MNGIRGYETGFAFVSQRNGREISINQICNEQRNKGAEKKGSVDEGKKKK
jgi:hypothetical protein